MSRMFIVYLCSLMLRSVGNAASAAVCLWRGRSRHSPCGIGRGACREGADAGQSITSCLQPGCQFAFSKQFRSTATPCDEERVARHNRG